MTEKPGEHDEILKEALIHYRKQYAWSGWNSMLNATEGERELARMKIRAIDRALEALPHLSFQGVSK